MNWLPRLVYKEIPDSIVQQRGFLIAHFDLSTHLGKFKWKFQIESLLRKMRIPHAIVNVLSVCALFVTGLPQAEPGNA